MWVDGGWTQRYRTSDEGLNGYRWGFMRRRAGKYEDEHRELKVNKELSVVLCWPWQEPLHTDHQRYRVSVSSSSSVNQQRVCPVHYFYDSRKQTTCSFSEHYVTLLCNSLFIIGVVVCFRSHLAEPVFSLSDVRYVHCCCQYYSILDDQSFRTCPSVGCWKMFGKCRKSPMSSWQGELKKNKQQVKVFNHIVSLS